MNKMKEGWVMKTLGEVCEILNGGTPDTTIPKFWDGEHLWITPKDMGKIKNIYVNDTLRKITEEGIKNSSAKILPVNSIILSSRAPIGHLAINTKPMCTNQGCKGIIPHKGISSLYLYYYLLKSVELLNSLGTGTTFKELSGSKLATVEIPIPSLTEQQRIVTLLDEAFAAIDKAKANAEQNLKNAKELFESYLQKVFSEKGEGWEEKILKDITEVKDGTHDSPKYINQGLPFITQKNIRTDGLSFDNTKFISLIDHEKFYKRSNVTYGDILISMIGANRGMAVIVDDKRTFSIKNVGLIKENERINQYFLLYYLKSPLAIKYVMYMSNGGAQEFIGLTALRNFPIPFPPLTEQRTIVSKLDALSSETKRLEKIYAQKIADLAELKKSVLAKAFSGEL